MTDTRRQLLVVAAMKLLKQHLTTTQMQLLRLRCVTPVPGEDRYYTLKEIAPILGKSYGYLRRLHAATLAQVRKLLVGIIAERPLQ